MVSKNMANILCKYRAMYQLVVPYLDSRYGCIFSDEAILDYEDLLVE